MSDRFSDIPPLVKSGPDSSKHVKYSLCYTYLNPTSGKIESAVEDYDNDLAGLEELRESYEEAVESPLCYDVHVYQKETIITEVLASHIRNLKSGFDIVNDIDKIANMERLGY